MAKASFNLTTAGTTADSSLASPLVFGDSSQLTGDFGLDDQAVPYLSLIQRQGMLMESFPSNLGEWCYDKSHALGNEMRVVFTHLSKRYEEDVPYGDEKLPSRWMTQQEAMASGLQYKEVADIDLLIVVKSDSPIWDHARIEGGKEGFVPVRYTVRSTAYGATVKILLRDMLGHLKKDLSSAYYTLSSVKKSGRGNTWFAPKLTVGEKTPEKVREGVRNYPGV